MEEGAKEAFCLLLWVANGGKLDAKGRPAFRLSGRTRGNCTTPSDCDGCKLMQQEIAQHPYGHAFWVCPECVTILVKDARARALSFRLPGHFSEGQCQYVGCTRPAVQLGNEEVPPRYSKFLQLIIYASS